MEPSWLSEDHPSFSSSPLHLIHHREAREEGKWESWVSQSSHDPMQCSSQCCSRGSWMQACALTKTFLCLLLFKPTQLLGGLLGRCWRTSPITYPGGEIAFQGRLSAPAPGMMTERVSAFFIFNVGIWAGAESCQVFPVLHTPLSKSPLENTERGLMLIAICLSFENLKQHLLAFPCESLTHDTARTPERKLCREHCHTKQQGGQMALQGVGVDHSLRHQMCRSLLEQEEACIWSRFAIKVGLPNSFHSVMCYNSFHCVFSTQSPPGIVFM